MHEFTPDEPADFTVSEAYDDTLADAPDKFGPSPDLACIEDPDILPEDTRTVEDVENEAYTMVDGHLYIETTNLFYRSYHYNVAVLAGVVAPEVMTERDSDEPFTILEAGCSKGRDTWCMASVLALHGIDFQIDAVDLNARVLQLAQQPYKGTKRDLEKQLGYWRLPVEVLDFFERVDASHIQPTQELRERVNFGQLDIRTQTPARGAYDAVVSNNVLCHYSNSDKTLPMADQIVDTVSASLRPGGIFTFSDRLIQSKSFTDKYFAAHGLIKAIDLYNKDGWDNHASAFFRRAPIPMPTPKPRRWSSVWPTFTSLL
jgi:chemotaxis methyl-accepting protein methylase